MERIEWITIGKKVYPMCYSIGARKKIEEAYESIQKFLECCKNDDRYIEAYLTGLEILIRYGCMRLNTLGDGELIENGAFNTSGTWIPISREELEVLIVQGQLSEISAKIIATLNKAAEKEIKATPTKETRKNSKTAPEATG